MPRAKKLEQIDSRTFSGGWAKAPDSQLWHFYATGKAPAPAVCGLGMQAPYIGARHPGGLLTGRPPRMCATCRRRAFMAGWLPGLGGPAWSRPGRDLRSTRHLYLDLRLLAAPACGNPTGRWQGGHPDEEPLTLGHDPFGEPKTCTKCVDSGTRLGFLQ